MHVMLCNKTFMNTKNYFKSNSNIKNYFGKVIVMHFIAFSNIE